MGGFSGGAGAAASMVFVFVSGRGASCVVVGGSRARFSAARREQQGDERDATDHFIARSRNAASIRCRPSGHVFKNARHITGVFVVTASSKSCAS